MSCRKYSPSPGPPMPAANACCCCCCCGHSPLAPMAARCIASAERRASPVIGSGPGAGENVYTSEDACGCCVCGCSGDVLYSELGLHDDAEEEEDEGPDVALVTTGD